MHRWTQNLMGTLPDGQVSETASPIMGVRLRTNAHPIPHFSGSLVHWDDDDDDDEFSKCLRDNHGLNHNFINTCARDFDTTLNYAMAGNGPPPKPWERAPAASSGPAPFKPPSPGSTSDVVESSGNAKPGEIVAASQRNPPAASAALARPLPTRPWEQNYGSSIGGYGSGMNYNSSYGTVGSYGGGMYGNSMYRGGGYGGGLYGGSGMYGGGMYGGGLGGSMGASYGMGMGMGMGGPYGDQDPNNPYGAPPSPPGFWISFLRVMQGVVTFFGRVAMLIDQNTQAFHMFMSALLQLFDRSGMLYGELARFVFRLLGIKTKSRNVHPGGPMGPHPNQIEGPKAAPSGSWENVWGNDANGM